MDDLVAPHEIMGVPSLVGSDCGPSGVWSLPCSAAAKAVNFVSITSTIWFRLAGGWWLGNDWLMIYGWWLGIDDWLMIGSYWMIAQFQIGWSVIHVFFGAWSVLMTPDLTSLTFKIVHIEFSKSYRLLAHDQQAVWNFDQLLLAQAQLPRVLCHESLHAKWPHMRFILVDWSQ